MSKTLDNAVVEMLSDEYAGSNIRMEDVEKVAKKYNIKVNALAKAILQDGIDDGWLIDEYFAW